MNGAFTRLCMEGVYDATRKRVLTFCGPTVVDLKAVRNHEGVSFKTNPDVFSAARAPWSAMSDPTVAQVDHAPLEDAGALGLVAEATYMVGDQLIVNGGLRLEFALRHPVAHMDAASSSSARRRGSASSPTRPARSPSSSSTSGCSSRTP